MSLNPQCGAAGPATGFMSSEAPPLTAGPSAELIAIRKRLGRIQNHESLGKVYGQEPDPFDRLMNDVLDLFQHLSSAGRMRIERALRTAPYHVRAAQGMYVVQLGEELRALVASGFPGPTPGKAPLIDARSRLWGTPEKRAQIRSQIESAQVEGKEIKITPVYGPIEAIDQVLYWEPMVLNRYEKWRGRPAVKLYGSAREVLNETTKDVLMHLGNIFVEAGVSLVHGLGDHGAMGVGSRAWLKAIDEKGKEGEVIVGGVPLYFRSGATFIEARTQAITPGFVAPRQGIDTRTLLLSSLANEVCRLFVKGGRGTREEESRNLLWRQLRGSIHTPDSHLPENGLAPTVVVDQLDFNAQTNAPEWFYDGLILDESRMQTGGTVDSEDSKDIHFIRVGPKTSEPPTGVNVHYFSSAENAANFVFKLCIESVAQARIAAAAWRRSQESPGQPTAPSRASKQMGH